MLENNSAWRRGRERVGDEWGDSPWRPNVEWQNYTCTRNTSHASIFPVLNGHLMTVVYGYMEDDRHTSKSAWTHRTWRPSWPTRLLICFVEVDRHSQRAPGHNLGQPSKYIQDLTTNILIWVTIKAAQLVPRCHPCPLQSILSSLARGTFLEGTSDSLSPLIKILQWLPNH